MEKKNDNISPDIKINKEENKNIDNNKNLNIKNLSAKILNKNENGIKLQVKNNELKEKKKKKMKEIIL